MKFDLKSFSISLSIPEKRIEIVSHWMKKGMPYILLALLTGVSVYFFLFYLNNGLGLSYNDARSHLDIGRRVVEGLKPGLAQIGSVWLPLPHLLMIPTIWNDFMWHTGLSGALQSMISFVFTSIIIYAFLKELGVSVLARLVGVFVFVSNLNILYMQSTAMTELLLLSTMTASVYQLLLWQKRNNMLHLIFASLFVMLSSLIRYDGWFLFIYVSALVVLLSFEKLGRKAAEGIFIFFATLAGLGIFLWFVWNLLIFKDPLYFAFGPYSAHAQQTQLEGAGVLATKGNLLFSIKVYLYALIYNSGLFTVILGTCGAISIWFTKKISINTQLVLTALFVPLIFNIMALYLGHSVLFIQGLSGDTWFNARYGLMMMPSLAIFIGYFVWKLEKLNYAVIPMILLVTVLALGNHDAVTIDDARVGSSQKNVSEVSGWLEKNAKATPGFVLISAASHDAIIFSSGLPMKKFIHEGTGTYWTAATTSPDRWARWIIMRTNDDNDLTFRSIKKTVGFKKYDKVASYPFADIYEIKPEFVSQLETKPVLPKQR